MTAQAERTVSAPVNPLGLAGIEFVEFTAPDAPGQAAMAAIFRAFGFSALARHRQHDMLYYRQHDIHLVLNRRPDGFAAAFSREHGPAISAMGWRVVDARQAFEEAVRRGARPMTDSTAKDHDLPAIYGIGDSLIYFVEDWGNREDGGYYGKAFAPLPSPELAVEKGFRVIDHLTNNVQKGTMDHWANFYKQVFGFTEIQYFDIRGEKTGLTSFALKSPCGSFSIPINEGSEAKSQIEEYLREYRGAGIQHLAFATDDLLASLDRLAGSGIETLDIADDYYESVFQRVPNVTEDPARIRRHRVLVDGDAEGYLLQIFTKNLFGPIFIELIQRKNHGAFGEGNFGALFQSIERDQARRGVL